MMLCACACSSSESESLAVRVTVPLAGSARPCQLAVQTVTGTASSEHARSSLATVASGFKFGPVAPRQRPGPNPASESGAGGPGATDGH